MNLERTAYRASGDSRRRSYAVGVCVSRSDRSASGRAARSRRRLRLPASDNPCPPARRAGLKSALPFLEAHALEDRVEVMSFMGEEELEQGREGQGAESGVDRDAGKLLGRECRDGGDQI